MAMTISMSVGRVAVLHDVRKELSANIDANLTKNNSIFVDKLYSYNYSIEDYTNAKFQPVIDEYNLKQTRPERRKTQSYVDLIKDENEKLLQKANDNKAKGIKKNVRKPTKLAHEYVLQVGNRETNGTTETDIELNRQYFKEVLEDIQRKYPHADILLATYHADEPNGTPHMHILVQFDGEGYKQGLSKQISMSKALELDGFERSQNRGDYAINRWTKDIQDTIMTDKLQEVFHAEREVIGEKRAHEDIRFFREKAKNEAQALEERKQELQEAEQSLVERHQELDESVELLEGMNDYYNGELERVQGELASAEAEQSQIKEKIAENESTLLQQLDKLDSINEQLSDMDELTSYLAQKRNENPPIEKYTIPPDKTFLGQITSPERHGVFVEGVTVEQVQSAFDHAHGTTRVREVWKDFMDKAHSEYERIVTEARQTVDKAKEIVKNQNQILDEARAEADGIIAKGKEEYNKIADQHNDLVYTINDLQDEYTDLKQKVESYQDFQREYEKLAKAKEVLSGECKYYYLEERLKGKREFGTFEFEELRKKGLVKAIYKDGSVRTVGSNEKGGWDYKTLDDEEKGLCKVGVLTDEPQVQIPTRLLNELSERVAKENLSDDLKEYLKQESQKQTQRHSLHLSM